MIASVMSWCGRATHSSALIRVSSVFHPWLTYPSIRRTRPDLESQPGEFFVGQEVLQFRQQGRFLKCQFLHHRGIGNELFERAAANEADASGPAHNLPR